MSASPFFLRGLGQLKRISAALVLIAASAAAQPASRAATPAAGEFVVIVNAANPTVSVDRDDLSRMFFKRLVKWPNGVAVDPIDLSPVTQPRIAFTKSVHRKPVGAVRAFWQQQIFSGRSVPPPEKGSDADVIEYVRQNPGAVGYISASHQLQSGVKPLEIRGSTQ